MTAILMVMCCSRSALGLIVPVARPGRRRTLPIPNAPVVFKRGLKPGYGFAAGHQVGDVLAGPLAFLEVGGNRAADQHGEVVADDRGIHHLMGDEDHHQAAPLALVHDAQHMGGLLDTERCGRTG